MRAADGDSVDLASVDMAKRARGRPRSLARSHGITQEVVELPEAKRGLVLSPRRWAVERSFL
ncbi:hypothetical protein ASF20_21260 [Methylobacterium sp. Leaf88]|nr:hypothetical protein ASF20_21260 [Methylobacterium sp. Leaf88]